MAGSRAWCPLHGRLGHSSRPTRPLLLLEVVSGVSLHFSTPLRPSSFFLHSSGSRALPSASSLFSRLFRPLVRILMKFGIFRRELLHPWWVVVKDEGKKETCACEFVWKN